MTRICAGVVIALMLGAVVWAQDLVTGKWQGDTQSGSQIVLDITAKKTALQGTLTRNAQPIPIMEGKVTKGGKKTTLTFKATLSDQTESFTGEVEGDEMKVWLDRQGPGAAAVLTRMKAKK